MATQTIHIHNTPPQPAWLAVFLLALRILTLFGAIGLFLVALSTKDVAAAIVGSALFLSADKKES